MKKVATFIFLFLMVFQLCVLAQTAPPDSIVQGKVKINGKLDNLDEFSTLVTVPVIMPDSVKLMTDIFVPMLQDCMTVTLDTATLNSFTDLDSASLADLGPAAELLKGIKLGDELGEVTIEIIPRYTQLFVYDRKWNASTNSWDTILDPSQYSMPMILTRTPYDKEGDATGRIITIFGYTYAMQDMRGRYSSEGVYFPMYSDSWNKNPYHGNFKHILDYTEFSEPKNGNRHEDGYNTIQYLSKHLTNEAMANIVESKNPYFAKILRDKDRDGSPDLYNICNGSMGMFGASALGNTQYQAAAAHRIKPDEPGLKALFPIVATNEHYRYTGYQNGVFRERIVTGWLKGQIFDVEDDRIGIDFDRQDNLHTSKDYDLPKPITVNNKTRTYFVNKFDASNLAIDHFVRMRYPEDDGSLGYPGYYPNSAGRGDMDASFSKVNASGEAVSPGRINSSGEVVDDPNGVLGFGTSRLPDLDHSRYENKDVPAYHLTGWWDIFTDGQIETWRLMKENAGPRSSRLQKLIIGPWAHQTVGGTKTGDMIYKENVTDILGFDIGDVDIEDLNTEDILESEIVSWFRYTLNYNEYATIGLPTVKLPEGDEQVLGVITFDKDTLVQLLNAIDSTILADPLVQLLLPTLPQDIPLKLAAKIPAHDHKIGFKNLINFLNASGPLENLPIELIISLDGLGFELQRLTIEIDLDPLGEPVIPELSGEEIVSAIDSVNFDKVPNVRFYVVGPVSDGITDNEQLGNYWYESDTFPITNKIEWKNMYMHKDSTLNFTAPTGDEGFSIYVHDPDEPVYSVGGANMIVSLPDGFRNVAEENDDSHGQINLKDPRWEHTTIDRPGVVSYEYTITEDSLSVIGFPIATLYAKSNPAGAVSGDPTDTDFFVRVLDVYPDGREYFVVEGCVNARARNYAKYIADTHGQEDINIPFTNIEAGSMYEYKFRMMPIAYTWGKGHQLKILISSSNWNRYQVNPNLPLEDGDFFRRQPLDGQKYKFNGVDMAPRIAVQRIAHSDIYPSNVQLPIYNKNVTSVEEPVTSGEIGVEAFVYPNPAVNELNIYMSKTANYDFRIINAIGQEVMKGEFYDHITLDLQKFDKGLYIVEITDSEAKVRITNKVSIL